MNKFFAMMVALVATLFVSNAMAWNPPPSPAPQSWISDPSHVLSDAAHARLDAKLKQINQSSANEMAALILPSLDGESIEDAGDLTSKAWGVGKKNLDNGVLVVLAMKEHKSRISTGKGVEGDLPDLKCNDILQAMRPYLRSGNVEGALGYAFDQASTLIANHKAEAVAQAAKANETGGGPPQASNNSSQTNTGTSSCQVSAPGANSGSTWPWVLGLLGLGLLGWWMAARSSARKAQRELEEETDRLLDQARRDREARQAQMSIPTPVVTVPVVPTPPVRPVAPARPAAPSFPVAPVVAAATVVAATAAADEEARRHREAEARRRREREEEDARARRRREEEDSRSSYSSSSSSSSDSSSSFSWGGGSDSGGSGGFGGGDSGGGGSSSDW